MSLRCMLIFFDSDKLLGARERVCVRQTSRQRERERGTAGTSEFLPASFSVYVFEIKTEL